VLLGEKGSLQQGSHETLMFRQTVWTKYTVFDVKGAGKYDHALNSKGYDKFFKNMFSLKSENDDALWCLLKDLYVIIREQIFNVWHVRNGKYQKCMSFAMSGCP